MKLLTIAALLVSLTASAARTFHKNDGSARSGNPGTFTKEDANTIKGYKGTEQGSGSIQAGESAGVPDSKPIGDNIEKEEAASKGTGTGSTSNPEEDKVLDMSTTPDSTRKTPTGDEVKLDEEEEE